MRARSVFALALVLALGCRSERYAPVSGTVTLDGKPLANATVSFQPIAEKGIDAGPGSTSKTGENGEYTLQTITGGSGAVVGKHRVMISALNPQVGEGDARPPRGGWPLADKVPKRYNAESTLTFDVRPGITNQADFPLTSR